MFTIVLYAHGITRVISPKNITHFVDVNIRARAKASKTGPAKKGGSESLVDRYWYGITSQHKIVRC
jgi:hypothetical protein